MSWVETVAEVYGDAVAGMVAGGWTLDAAVAHHDGTCDRELCSSHHGRTDVHAILLDVAAAIDTVQDELRDECEAGVRRGAEQLSAAADELLSLVRSW